MENLGGRAVKDYALLERVEVGIQSDLYHGYQSVLGRDVAVRVIAPEISGTPAFIRRFDREARRLARLEHMRIVPLYDFWRDPEGAYLVRRWLRGGSLRELLSSGPLSTIRAARLLEEIASGLSAAHARGVVHGHLTASNILFDSEGNTYVADIGIARMVDLDGLPPPTHPEQRLPFQTDLRALGSVLCQILAGHPRDVVRAGDCVYRPVKFPRLDDDVQENVNCIIQKALATEGDLQFRDALEMATAFRSAVKIESPLALPLEALTRREENVLARIVAGMTNRQIAQELVIEVSTVKWYITQIYRKLGVRSRKQAIAAVKKSGLPGTAEEPNAVAEVVQGAAVGPVNPYKGLRAFDVSDARDFFGRTQMVNRLLKRLTERHEYANFLAIVGPSGSGKSSLINAGLIPALAQGEVQGSEQWYVARMKPGQRPLDQLEIALTRVATGEAIDIGAQLRRDDRGLLRAAELILPDDGNDLLLIVDQFEEVFTMVDDEWERGHFLALLYQAAIASRSRLRIIAALRADFYDRPLQLPDFGKLVRERMETVLPLDAEELEKAIVGPAGQVGVNFEDGLVATIIDDVVNRPGALPLLQYAITELFENRVGCHLTHAGYAQIGGAVGALGTKAELIFNEFDEEAQQAVRHMFLRLIVPGDNGSDARRRVLRKELLSVAQEPAWMDEAIDTFSAYRLISLDHDPASRHPTVEVAHEALIQIWERLRQWAAESREDLNMRRQLTAAAREWAETERDPGFLVPGGSRLALFQSWRQKSDLPLTPLETAFLNASVAADLLRQQRKRKQARARRRLTRGLIAALSLGFVASLVLALLALRGQRAAAESEQAALRQASIGLAARAISQLEGNTPERGALLPMTALETYPYTPQAESALARSVYGTHRFTTLDGIFTGANPIAYSPDGTLIAGGERGTIWDAQSGSIVVELDPNATGHRVSDIAWLPDGSGIVLARAAGDSEVIIVDLDTGTERVAHSLHLVEANSVAVNAAGTLVLSSGNVFAYMWSVESGLNVLSFSGHIGGIEDAIWSPDEQLVATAGRDGDIRIWDAETGDALRQLTAHHDGVRALSWSADGLLLASAGNDGLGRVWSAGSGELLLTLVGHSTPVSDIAWSPDGSRLATAASDGSVRVWEPVGGIQLAAFSSGDAQLSAISWSPDGRRLAVGGRPSPRIWEVATPIVRLTGYAQGRDMTVATIDPYWSSDSAWVGVGGRSDSTYRLWEAATGELLATYEAVLSGWGGVNPAGTELYLTSPPRILNLESSDERRLLQAGTFPVVWSDDGSLLTGRFLFPANAHPVYDAQTLMLLHMGNWDRCVAYLPGIPAPNGALLALTCPVGNETAVLIANPLTGETIQILDGHDDATIAASWSPDGLKLATTSADLTIRVWDVAAERVLTVFDGHGALPTAVDWSPDGSRLVSGDAGGDVLVWDAENGFEVNRYDVGGYVSGVRWAPDGQRVLTTGDFPAPDIRPIWQSTEQLIAYARACCLFRDLTAAEKKQFGLPP